MFGHKRMRDSICWCHNLEVLEANDNYLEKLPAKLGDMKRLKHLRQEQSSGRCRLWVRGDHAKYTMRVRQREG